MFCGARKLPEVPETLHACRTSNKGKLWTAEFRDGRSDAPDALLAALKTVNRRLVQHHPKSSNSGRVLRLKVEPAVRRTASKTRSGPTSDASGTQGGIDELLYSRQSQIAERLLSAELAACQPTVVYFAVIHSEVVPFSQQRRALQGTGVKLRPMACPTMLDFIRSEHNVSLDEAPQLGTSATDKRLGRVAPPDHQIPLQHDSALVELTYFAR